MVLNTEGHTEQNIKNKRRQNTDQNLEDYGSKTEWDREKNMVWNSEGNNE